MTTTHDLAPFGAALPRFVGFDNLFRDMELLTKTTNQQNYPPHNIVKYDNETYQIEIATAGFSKDELKVEHHNTDLVVSGEQQGARDDEPLTFIHKGISSKKFQKAFKIAEHMHVVNAIYTDGVLYIFLKLELPEEKKPKVISIR